MKMPSVPFLEKKEKPEYFLGLVLRDEKAIAIILEQVGTKLRILSQKEEYFKDTIETSTVEEFLNVLDKAISTAEEALPPNIETKKTIFGLKETWVEGNKIKKEYLDKLKKASDELDMTPVGFLVNTEAIVNLMQKEEGAPISAVIADLGKRHTSITLVKANRIVEVKSSEIHESASFTVDALLKHMESAEILPSRLVIFDADEKLVQEFISHQWSKSLPFLHLPQIVNLSPRFDVKAMLYGASAQMGLQAMPEFSQKDFEAEIPKIDEDTQEKSAEKTEEVKEEKQEEEIKTIDSNNSLAFFGFIENEDIAKAPKPELPKEEVKTAAPIETPKEIATGEVIEEIPEELKLEETKGNIPAQVMGVLPLAQKTFAKIIGILKKLNLSKINSPALRNILAQKFIIFPLGVIIILASIYIFLLSSVKATVTLDVTPKIAEETKTAIFSVDSPTDVENNVIAAEFVDISEEGSLSKNATGKKSTGDKAKGTVTIFNNSDSEKTFPSGTIISSADKDYTLNKSATVPGASGDVFSGTKPGTVNADVTADDFGTEYNLPSNSKFTIGDDSFIAAKNDDAFSGGTKKDIIVVSKEDTDNLLEDLPGELEEKAKQDIRNKISSDKEVLSTFTDKTVTKKDFDKDVGDEAKQVSLKGTVSFTAISYSKKDLIDFSSALLDSGDLTVNKDDLEIKVNDITVKDKEAEAELAISAKLFPKIDNDALAGKIKNLTIESARDQLSKIPQVSNVEISISPNLPFIPKKLPGNSKNIKIVVNNG